jgi:anti-sigma factor RsiW
MSKPTFHDIEQISAYLDGQLDQSQKTRLVARIVKDPDLAEALEQLRQVRALLQQTPHRRSPRNFTLTPKMAGIRPPVPRVVPALSWASAIAMLLFIFTFGFNLLAQGGFGAAAPRASDLYSGAGQAPLATSAPAMVAPATAAPATAPPVTSAPAFVAPPNNTSTAVESIPGKATVMTKSAETRTRSAATTPVFSTPTAPQATEQAVTNSTSSSPPVRPQPKRAIPWQYIWLSLAVLLVSAALLIRWLNRLAFARRTRPK